MRMFVLAVAFCLLALPAHATTYYVDADCGNVSTYVPATGACTGGSAVVRTTIAGGVVLPVAGDTLLVRGGTYAENINLNNTVIASGSSWASSATYVYIAAYPGDCTNVACEDVNIKDMNLPSCTGCNTTSLAYVWFDGFDMIAPTSGNDAISIWGATHHIRIYNFEAANATGGAHMGVAMQIGPNGPRGFIEISRGLVHDNQGCDNNPCVSGETAHGLYIATTDNLIEYVTVYLNGHLGLQLYSSFATSDRNIVRYSTFHDNGQKYTASGGGIQIGDGVQNYVYGNLVYSELGGIVVGNGGSGNFVYNNTLDSIRDNGIESNQASVTISNNIITSTGGDGINILAGSITSCLNNLTTETITDTVSGSCTGTVSAAAGYVGGGDYHILTSSAAKDAGVNTSATVTTDQDGTSRPQGSAVDIGYDEFISVGGGTGPGSAGAVRVR